MVSPNGKTSGASFEISTSCISLISGIGNEMSLPLGIVASVVILERETSGAVESITTTLCDDVARFPDESETIQVTTVSPSGKFSGASLDNDSTLT